MKKNLLSLLLMGLCIVAMQAQDLITLRDGTDIQAKVLQVSPNEIKYKRTDNPDGPDFILPTANVLLIRYANGTNQVFEKIRQPAPEQAPTQVSTKPEHDDIYYSPTPQAAPMHQDVRGDIPLGLRYKDYKLIYNPKDYVRQPTDRHNPTVSGFCSFLIPGLGQMICGEVGRGFGYLGGAVACGAAVGTGYGLLFAGIVKATTSEGSSGKGALTGGTLLIIGGAAGLLAVDICAIVDGARVAKIKNMYERDVRRQISTLDMRLQPYVSTFSTATSKTPVAGFSLAVNF